ncbi:MAG: VirB4 family type IV secretion system protein [Bacilli bacterium]
MSLSSAAILGLAAASYALPNKFFKFFSAQHEASRVSDFIPFNKIGDDEMTVFCDDGSCFRVIEVEGAIYAGKAQSVIDQILNRRKSWFFSLRQTPLTLRIISRRHKLKIPKPPSFEGVASQINETWHEHLQNTYFTTHHIIMSVDNPSKIGRIDTVFNDLKNFLSEFKPKILKNVTDPILGGSPLLSFLASLISDYQHIIPRPNKDLFLKESISACSLFFGENGEAITDNGFGKRHRAAFGIRAFPEYSTTQIVQKILNLPLQTSIMIHAEPLAQEIAIGKVKYGNKQSSLFNKRENVLITDEWETIEDELSADKESLFKTEIIFYVTADSEEELKTAVDIVGGKLGSLQTRVLREKSLTERCYFARLPGYNFFTRAYTLCASDLAEFTPWLAEPTGFKGCDWGNRPIQYFPTASSGSPYGFILHEHDGEQAPPHVAMFAPTGGGKTVFAAFLASGVLANYPNAKVFAFDRDKGLEVLTEAYGGSYLTMLEMQINPFDCEGSEEDKRFLEAWLALITDCKDDLSQNEIARAVKQIFELPLQDRSLKTLSELYLDADGQVKKSLIKWTVTGRYSAMFSGATDTTKTIFNKSRFIVFDLSGVDNDEVASAALSFFLFHQIEKNSSSGNPSMLFVDEAATLLRDDNLAAEVDKTLRTARKRRLSVVLAFQELASLKTSKVRSSVIVNCRRLLFWQGTAKAVEDCEAFSFTPEELEFVLGKGTPFPDGKRIILNRTESESVFLETDISALGKLLKVFRGGPAPVKQMEKAKTLAEQGEGSWLKHYLNM